MLQRSDAVLLVLDARAGVLPGDHAVVAWLRSHHAARLLLVANKAERGGGGEAPGANDCACSRRDASPGKFRDGAVCYMFQSCWSRRICISKHASSA